MSHVLTAPTYGHIIDITLLSGWLYQRQTIAAGEAGSRPEQCAVDARGFVQMINSTMRA